MKSWSAALFGRLRAKIAADAAEDLEPEPRFAETWDSWLIRELDRSRRRTELAEAEALSHNPADPAPVASQGLAPFLEWSARQERRRRARRTAA